MRTTIIYFRKFWPVLFILSILTVISILNFRANTYLIGWDNLQTELNIGLNIKRALFAVWEEYQGLGHIAGNAFAADLPRQLLQLLLSPIVPETFLRQFYVFLMLFTGAFGAYFLFKKLFFTGKDLRNTILPVVGSLFYVLNLSTIQTFYAPFEPFITHFGFLPWLILAAVLYIQSNSRKNLVILIIVNILALPQSEVPTVFFVYLLILSIIFLTIFLKEKTKLILTNFLKLIFIILILNSFWLLPFLYFVITSSSVPLNAKINQTATETVFLQNKAFGNLKDVVLLKGFWFNNVDPNLKGNFTYMFSPWKQYYSNPVMEFIGYLFFTVILLGLLSAIKSRKPFQIFFAIFFLFFFTMLAIDTPVLSLVSEIIRKIPLVSEVFRFPFTKFSIILSLSYSVLFVFGLNKLILFFSKFLKSEKLPLLILSFSFFVLAIISALPVFQGNLFYSKEKIQIPNEYSKLFNYFKTQNPNTRIANFPQYTFWGWSYYKWGYGGSGFIWYGIKQPILDRAFDVWATSDENYYWELSNALYSKNQQQFENVLKKYQINWLVLDKNVFDPSFSEDVFIHELNSLIDTIPSIKKAASFGSIDVYKVSSKDNPNNYIFTQKELPLVNTYKWNNNDKAYSELGNYVSSPNPNYTYPFRSLFSNKLQSQLEFSAKEEDGFITLANNLPLSGKVTFDIPSYFKNEKIVAAKVIAEKNSENGFTVNLEIIPAEITIRKGPVVSKLYSKRFTKTLATITQGYPGNIGININGVKTYSLMATTGITDNNYTFLSLTQDNLIVISNPTNNLSETQVITPANLESLLSNTNSISLNIDRDSTVEVKIPKISGDYDSYERIPIKDTVLEVKNCDNFNKGPFSAQMPNGMLELKSKNSIACISYYMPNLEHNLSYAMFINNTNIKGRALSSWLLNENEKFSPINTFLDNENRQTASFVIPPQEEFGNAYTLHLENISLTNDETVNRVGKIAVFPIPYSFITGIKTVSEATLKPSNQSLKISSVSHPNPSYYQIENVTGKGTLILSQSYDKGWKAYEARGYFPFIFGKELKNHVLINNWENGWIIDSEQNNSNLVIVYLPQYLQYAGDAALILLILTILLILIRAKRHEKHFN